jgi:hypothetical protein
MRTTGGSFSGAMTLLLLSLPSLRASAATTMVTCSGAISASLQSAIDAAADGDEIDVSAGNCSFNVSWTNKNIAIVGAGSSATLVNTGSFSVTIKDPSHGKFRISGIGFSGTPSGQSISILGSGLSSSVLGFRLDHLAFTYPNGSGDIIRIAGGPIWGLIDHINMTYGGAYNIGVIISDYVDSEYQNAPATFMGEMSAKLAIDLGGPSAVYIEDSSFTLVGSTAYFGVVDSSSGGQRLVFRHNTVSGGLVYSHWTRGGEWDGHKYEIYNNHFDCNTPSAGALPLIARLESGTGVIYNNTLVNCTTSAAVQVDEGRGCGGSKVSPSLDCDGTRAWDSNGGDSSAPGWPCMGQIGTACIAGNCARGAMDNVPLLLWNNGTDNGCSSGGACTNNISVTVNDHDGDTNDVCTRPMPSYIKSTPHVASSSKYNGAVDYCVSATQPASCGTYSNSYHAYPYPHPLQGGSTGGTGAPAAPSNLTATVR